MTDPGAGERFDEIQEDVEQQRKQDHEVDVHIPLETIWSFFGKIIRKIKNG